MTSRRTLLLGLCVGAALVALLAWLLSGEQTPVGSSPAGEEPASTPESGAMLRGHSDRGKASGDTEAADSKTEPEAQTETAAQKILRVRVLSPAGQPVEEATVHWVARDKSAKYFSAPPAELQRLEMGHVESLLGPKHVRLGEDAKTNAEGIAVLKIPVEGGVGILARPHGRDWTRYTKAAMAIDPKTLPGQVEIKLNEAISLEVRAVGPDGDPRPHARIRCSHSYGARIGAGVLHTDAEGRAQVHGLSPLIPLYLAPMSWGLSEARRGVWHRPLDGDVRIRFLTQDDLRITLPSSHPQSRFFVGIFRSDTQTLVGFETSWTDEERTIRLTIHLPDVPLRILVNSEIGTRIGVLQDVVPRAEPHVLNLVDSSELVGTVRSATGEPVPDASVRVIAQGFPCQVAQADARGEFRVPRLPPGELELIAYDKGVSHYAQMRLEAPVSEPITIRLDRNTRVADLALQLPESHAESDRLHAETTIGINTVRLPTSTSTVRRHDEQGRLLRAPRVRCGPIPGGSCRIFITCTVRRFSLTEEGKYERRYVGEVDLGPEQTRATVMMKRVAK